VQRHNALEENFQEQMRKLEKEVEETQNFSETHGGSKKESIFCVNVPAHPKPFCPQSKRTLPTPSSPWAKKQLAMQQKVAWILKIHVRIV
jgi:hypothetical protein